MNVGPKEGRAMSHDEIARRLGIRRETVLRVEQRALRKLRLSLERIADALERIADKVAPHAKVQSIASGSRGLPQCANGHSMQPTDNYCQTCERERRSGSSPKPAPSNDAA